MTRMKKAGKFDMDFLISRIETPVAWLSKQLVYCIDFSYRKQTNALREWKGFMAIAGGMQT